MKMKLKELLKYGGKFFKYIKQRPFSVSLQNLEKSEYIFKKMRKTEYTYCFFRKSEHK